MDKIAITIDYEFDWGGRVKSSYAIDYMLERVLDIANIHNSKFTFFISGETVKRTKHHILSIQSNSHEIASHGFNHNIVYDKLTKDELKREICDSKNILEDLTGNKIYGFRTPQFRKNRWNEELLLECGYRYDSSSVETDFLNRYKKNQHQYEKITNFPVSTIYGKLPAGLKWINLFGNFVKSNNQIKVIYLHLFDLLSMKDILKLYDKSVINNIVLLFYLSRRGTVLKSFESISKKSDTLINYLYEENAN